MKWNLLEMLRIYRYFREALGSILFVRTCPLCGERLEGEMVDGRQRYVCASCVKTLPRTEHASLRGNIVEDYFYKDERFVRGAAFLYYQKNDAVQTLVHAFKYRYQPEIAYQLSHEAALDYLQSDFFDEIDVIIPIPLHPRRLHARGYNQSDYIARALGDVAHILVDVHHLVRQKNNPQQATTKGKEREQNVRDIFVVSHPEDLYRKHILLVDDVLTTGSTIRSAMKALEVCRGCKISVFVLGKAR